MTGKRLIRFATATSVAAISFGVSTQAALAQTSTGAGQIETVVVTGSLIKGTPEDAAFPVTVLTTEDIEKRGSPSLVNLFKAEPSMAGVMGDSNQFQAGRGQGAEGSGSVNLRGLGPDRTLVLLNGHRMPLLYDYIVNTHNLPISAISRVEVLKDGAAATYGSDAIGGVVNFITRTDFEGLEADANYTAIRGSAGDYTASLTWGDVESNWNILISAGFQHRSTLTASDRPWTDPGIAINGSGWVYSSNPTEFIPVAPNGSGFLAAVGPQTLDVGCLTLGESNYPYPTYCRSDNVKYDNLVETQDSFQTYAEVNADLPHDMKLHVEGTYAYTDVPHFLYPPSFNEPKAVSSTVLPTNINPASFVAGTSPPLFNNFFVPMTNPGLAAYAAANPSQFPAGTTGIFLPVGLYRPFFSGGSPIYGANTGSQAVRMQNQYRVSADLSGAFHGSDITWDLNATYGVNNYYLKGYDSTGGQIELALRGLGGPNCNWQTGTPGQGGCMWLNPMSNAIAGAPRFGIPTNPGYNPAVANSPDLAKWLMNSQESWETSRTAEVNLVFNGALPWMTLPGGDITWAAGGQFRRTEYNAHFSKLANSDQSPCPDSILNIPNANICTPSPNTPLGLAVANHNVVVGNNIYAGFGELSLPVTAELNVDLAARIEDYGSHGGTTFNPQLRAKYQLTDWLAFRGSAGTTFRAPPILDLANNAYTTLSGVLGTTRPVDFVGNPNLKPETAKVYSLGTIVNVGGFHGAVDYYNYDVKNIITTQPLTNIVNYVFPNGASGANNCATVDPTFLAQHFVFAGTCSAMNLQRVETSYTNGPNARLQGVDASASYTFDDVFGGAFTLGANANDTFMYKFAAFTVGSLPIAGFNGAGKGNYGTVGYPMLRLKGYLYANYAGDGYNIRWGVRYNSSYVDQRYAVGALGYHVDSAILHDLSATVDLTDETMLSLSVNNIFNTSPPFSIQALSYDPLTGDPLGRNITVGLKLKM